MCFGYLWHRFLSLHCKLQTRQQFCSRGMPHCLYHNKVSDNKSMGFLGLESKLSYELCTACMMRSYKWSEVTLESNDVCSCIPAQVVLSYEPGNTESLWRFVWLDAAFHLSLWQIIKLMVPALWEMSSPQTMFNKRPANLDRCLVSVNRPRQGGLATAVTHTTARASELFPSGSINLHVV